MPSIDPPELARQYSNASNLEARINLHRRYSTNPYGWTAWVFDQMAFPPSGRLLEIGCGNGQLWTDNKNRLPADLSMILTDISPGMLADAKEQLASTVADFTFLVADAESLPFESHMVDMVVANHMLYHVPHIETALAEIRRVLRPGGTLYCTTNGDTYMKEVGELLVAFDPEINYGRRFRLGFTLQSGPALLSKYFQDVEVRQYPDSLAVTSADDLIRYILSTGAVSNAVDLLRGEKLEAFRTDVDTRIKTNGSIHVSKQSGILIGKAAA